jgi:hypothetical protein
MAALTGAPFVVLLVPAFLLTSGAPDPGATAGQIQRYFLAHKSHYSVGGLLTVLAVVRNRVRRLVPQRRFIIYKSRALPVWLAWVSWLLGLLGATFVLSFASLAATPLWVLYVGILLASRNPALASPSADSAG